MFFYLLLIFTLLIPIDNRMSKWLNFGGGINLSTIFTILLIIGWIFRERSKREKNYTKNPLAIPVLFFILFTYLSFFTGFIKLNIPFFGNEFSTFKSFVTPFILFFIVSSGIKDKKKMKFLVYTMSFMVVLTALVAIKEFRGANIWHYDEGRRVEVFGMQPNMLGGFFAQFIPILAGFAFMAKKIRTRIFFISMFCICLPGLMFTYSRGAYLSIVGALIIMGLLGGRKALIGLTVILFIAITAQSILLSHGRIIPVSVKERFEMLTNDEKREEDTSVILRRQVWKIAEERIGESPIFGWGYGAVSYVLPYDTHNMYLRIALENGIPTLLILIWLLIKAILVSLKLYKSSEDDFDKSIALGFIGSVTALAIGNFFGARLTLLSTNAYFGILMGFVASIYTRLNNDKNSLSY